MKNINWPEAVIQETSHLAKQQEAPRDNPVEGTVETDSLGSFKNNESIVFSDPYLRENYEMFSHIPLFCMQG